MGKVLNKKKWKEGELLEEIRKHFAFSHKEFAKRLDITYAWEYQLMKKAKIPDSIKMLCKRVYTVPDEYWLGQKPPHEILKYLKISPIDEVKYYAVKEENEHLRQLMQEKDEKIMELQNKVIELMEKGK
jgi:hypothetical protein